MKTRVGRGVAWVLLTLGMVAAGGVVWGLRVQLGRAAASEGRSEERVDVVVSRRTIRQGTTLGADDLEVRLLPKAVVGTRTVLPFEAALGRTARETILAGEEVRRERLAWPEEGIGLAATLEPGLRAMTVTADTALAMAGQVRPGNYVDFVVTIYPEGEAGRWQTFTFLQAIEVLAVGAEVGEARGGGTTRTTTGTAPVAGGSAPGARRGAEGEGRARG